MGTLPRPRKSANGSARRGADGRRVPPAPKPGLVTYGIQHQDWAAYASFNEKLATDSEWQQFLASVVQGANPSGVLQSGALLNEITP